MNNPFTFDYIFTAPREFGPYALTYFIVFALGTLLCNYVFFWGKYRFKSNLLTYTLINRASRAGAIAFSLGFFFCLSRVVQLQPFNVRLFMDIALLILAYFVVRGVLYLIQTYPKAKAEWGTVQTSSTPRKDKLEATASIAPARKAIATPAMATAAADGGAETGETRAEADDTAKASQAVDRQELSRRAVNRRERKRKSR